MKAMLRTLVAIGGVLLICAVGAAPALAAAGDPLFAYVPLATPPVGYLIGPCGLGVDSNEQLFVSDYYHDTIDIYQRRTTPGSELQFNRQLVGVDSLDGPCGLALDSSNRLYVNDFDRGVLRFGAAPSFGTATLVAGAGADSTHPTGVAVDPVTDDVYVDARTYLTGYDSAGTQLSDGSGLLKIGLGTLGDGYGLATGLSGRLYVADASDKTVKVYSPGIDKVNPVLTITGPPGGFSSLRYATLAVDRAHDLLYVIDDLHPAYTEEPAAKVDVFNSTTGSYLGVLKYQIIDARPSGLTVDRADGRVYVTSGNADQAGIYAYPAGSQVASSQPPALGLTVSVIGRGTGEVTSSLGKLSCSSSCTSEIRSAAMVTLTAAPDVGSAFSGWSGGGCSGLGECTLAMTHATMVSADFESNESNPLQTETSPHALLSAQTIASVQPHLPLSSPRRGGRSRHHRHHRARR